MESRFLDSQRFRSWNRHQKYLTEPHLALVRKSRLILLRSRLIFPWQNSSHKNMSLTHTTSPTQRPRRYCDSVNRLVSLTLKKSHRILFISTAICLEEKILIKLMQYCAR